MAPSGPNFGLSKPINIKSYLLYPSKRVCENERKVKRFPSNRVKEINVIQHLNEVPPCFFRKIQGCLISGAFEVIPSNLSPHLATPLAMSSPRVVVCR